MVIADVNHKLVYGEDIGHSGDHRKFLDTCHWLIERLKTHVQSRTKTQKAVLLVVVQERSTRLI